MRELWFIYICGVVSPWRFQRHTLEPRPNAWEFIPYEFLNQQLLGMQADVNREMCNTTNTIAVSKANTKYNDSV